MRILHIRFSLENKNKLCNLGLECFSSIPPVSVCQVITSWKISKLCAPSADRGKGLWGGEVVLSSGVTRGHWFLSPNRLRAPTSQTQTNLSCCWPKLTARPSEGRGFAVCPSWSGHFHRQYIVKDPGFRNTGLTGSRWSRWWSTYKVSLADVKDTVGKMEVLRACGRSTEAERGRQRG